MSKQIKSDDEIDKLSFSQASPIRRLDKLTRAEKDILDYDSKKRRRNHYKPFWKVQIDELKWWRDNEERAEERVERRLSNLLNKPPEEVKKALLEIERDFTIFGRQDKLRNFSSQYGRVLGTRNGFIHPCFSPYWVPPFPYCLPHLLNELRRGEAEKYLHRIQVAVPQYERKYTTRVESLKRALESVRKQIEVTRRQRKKREITLRKYHGKGRDTRRIKFSESEDDGSIEREGFHAF